MTCARVPNLPSFNDLVSPSTGLPLWVHSPQEYAAAKARTQEVERLLRRWRDQAILAEVVRLFEAYPWVTAMRLTSDGTRDGIVDGLKLRGIPPAGAGDPGTRLPVDERHRVEERMGAVFATLCPHASEEVWAYADTWFERATYRAAWPMALGMPTGFELDAFVDRVRQVLMAELAQGRTPADPVLRRATADGENLAPDDDGEGDG